MLDLHTHVLPGIDDGPRTLEDALALMQALVDDGVQHVVATPHIYPGIFDNTAEGIAQVFEQLRHEVVQRGLPITMSCAAEVRICADLLDWLREGRLPLMGGGSGDGAALLLELPDGAIPLGTDTIVSQLMAAGVTPIIAHPERNRAVMQDLDRLDPLLRLGARLQVTAGSVLGDFGSKAKLTAMGLLQRGVVDFVASDSHNLGARRPRMAAARAWLVENFDEALAERLTETQPAQMAGVGSLAVTTAQGWAIRDLPAHGKPAAPAARPAPVATAWGLDTLQDWDSGTPAALEKPLGPGWFEASVAEAVGMAPALTPADLVLDMAAWAPTAAPALTPMPTPVSTPTPEPALTTLDFAHAPGPAAAQPVRAKSPDPMNWGQLEFAAPAPVGGATPRAAGKPAAVAPAAAAPVQGRPSGQGDELDELVDASLAGMPDSAFDSVDDFRYELDVDSAGLWDEYQDTLPLDARRGNPPSAQPAGGAAAQEPPLAQGFGAMAFKR